jgi:hypothetical protein
VWDEALSLSISSLSLSLFLTSSHPVVLQSSMWQDREWVEAGKMQSCKEVDPSKTRWIEELEGVKKLFGVYEKDFSL